MNTDIKNQGAIKPLLKGGILRGLGAKIAQKAQPGQVEPSPPPAHAHGIAYLKLVYKTFKTLQSSRPIFPQSFVTCPGLANELRSTAIYHVCADINTAVICLNLKKFVDHRNRVDVPHGMFGFSLQNFYKRRQIKDTLYMDVLHMVQPNVIQQVKDSIVIQDVHDYISRLIEAFGKKELDDVLEDLRDASRLLVIGEAIQKEYEMNSDELQHLRFKVNSYKKYERDTIDQLNSKVYDAMNKCVDHELVKAPIEFRYQLGYQVGGIKQYEMKLIMAEARTSNLLEKWDFYLKRENFGSNHARDKLKADIETLKSRLEKLSKLYDEESDRLDGEIIYFSTDLDTMKNETIDNKKLMAHYEEEIVKLRAWEKEKEEKERAKMIAKRLKEEQKRLKAEALAAKKAKRKLR